MADLKYVTYCGLYCKHCANIARIPLQAKALYDTMKKEGYEYFGPMESPEFNNFWKYLGTLVVLDKECPACRGGCGDPECRIRICAREKQQEICVYCEDYPCAHFQQLARRYPNLIADGSMLKEIGVEAWILEQEQRCQRGFCFSDSRYNINSE